MAGVPVAVGARVVQLSLAQLELPALSLGMAVFCTWLGKESTGDRKGLPGSDLMQLGIAGRRQASSGCKSLSFSHRIRILLPQVVPGRKVRAWWGSTTGMFAWQSRMGKGFFLRSCVVTAGLGLQLSLPSSSAPAFY